MEESLVLISEDCMYGRNDVLLYPETRQKIYLPLNTFRECHFLRILSIINGIDHFPILLNCWPILFFYASCQAIL